MFIVYIKYEGNNISTMTTTLIFVISCEVFGLVEPFIVGGGMSCQNVANMQ
jgi:hypothetical protein